MKYGYEDGWFVEFEDAARGFLESDAAQGEAVQIIDKDGMDDMALPKAEATPDEMTKRAAILRLVLNDVTSQYVGQ